MVYEILHQNHGGGYRIFHFGFFGWGNRKWSLRGLLAMVGSWVSHQWFQFRGCLYRLLQYFFFFSPIFAFIFCCFADPVGFLVFGCIFVRSLLGCVIVFQFQYICIRCFLKSFISSQWRVNWRFYLGWHLTVLLLLLFLDKCTPLIEAQAKNTAYAEASLRNTTDYLKKSSRQNHQTS